MSACWNDNAWMHRDLFKGMDKLRWKSLQWPDGSTFEGLTKDDQCHIRGVFKYPNGDRYEGEYFDNEMDGFGVFVWKNGTVYRGEWAKNQMQGCGVMIAKQRGSLVVEEGYFHEDEWVGDVMACSVDQANAAARTADMASKMARAFEFPQPGQRLGESSGGRGQEAGHGGGERRRRRFGWFGLRRRRREQQQQQQDEEGKGGAAPGS